MRWWGWGREDRRVLISAELADLLDTTLALSGATRGPVELADVQLPAAKLSRRARTRLADSVGGDGWVRSDAPARITHAGGRSYLDLVALRGGELAGAPDAVVYPVSHEQVQAVLSACSAERVAVVPYGGGTSAVGGLAPIAGDQHAVVSLDLSRLIGLLSVDPRSLTISVAAGTRAPALEAALAEHDLTLGHFPDSFELVSLGGCAATRSVGQSSGGFARIDEAIQGLRMATPAGEFSPAEFPVDSAGPSPRELMIGSEGIFGVITALLLSVRPRPARNLYEGLVFEHVQDAVEALRIVAQDRATPDVVRLTDDVATDLVLSAGERTGRRSPLRRHGLRGRASVLLIVGWEGQRDGVQRRRLHAMTLLRRAGGTPIGEPAGRAWARSRFAMPYLRDELLARGVMVTSFETVASWTRLEALAVDVSATLVDSLGARGTPPLVGFQVSHLYESGASLSFHVLARALEGQEESQWRVARDAVSAAIARAGAPVSHHQGIGRDNAGWAAASLGSLGVSTLRALKAQLDPVGVMNPGKLIPE
jgi:alkyldihydroxyacetonephosphate synthase